MKNNKLVLALLMVLVLFASCELVKNDDNGADKSALEAEISDAQTLVDSVEVGTTIGDVYYQEDIDTLEAAIEAAQAVVDNVNATQAEVDTAKTTLWQAATVFEWSIIEYEYTPAEGINGRQITYDGEPYYIKGVCWNPVPAGQNHPYVNGFSEYAEMDSALMAEAGINTIRTYDPITDKDVLDHFHANGIKVINTVYVYGGDAVSNVTARVNAVKDHPAILMWAVGNEWNYNGFYTGVNAADSLDRVNEAAKLIREADTTRPICTVYGELPSQRVYDSLPNVDVWGINYYSGLTFNDVFEQWEALSDKPMFMAEYGADSYDATLNDGAGGENEEAQAEATRVLTQLLLDNSSVADASNVCSGGTIFSWADEWWKDQTGELDVQDVGGIAPGGGPYPDMTFNEEFWGITDIDRNPKQAFYELKTLFVE